MNMPPEAAMWGVGIVAVIVASHVRLETRFGSHATQANARIKRLEQLAGIDVSNGAEPVFVRDEVCALRHSSIGSEVRAMHAENLRAMTEISGQLGELRRTLLERGGEG